MFREGEEGEIKTEKMFVDEEGYVGDGCIVRDEDVFEEERPSCSAAEIPLRATPPRSNRSIARTDPRLGKSSILTCGFDNDTNDTIRGLDECEEWLEAPHRRIPKTRSKCLSRARVYIRPHEHIQQDYTSPSLATISDAWGWDPGSTDGVR